MATFMKFEDESEATRQIAFWAVVVITCALAVFNISGALAGTEGDMLLYIPRLAFAVLIFGAEMLAAVALVRVMLAPNRLRKIIGGVLFLGVAWVCVQNGIKTGHIIMPSVFGEDARTLDAKAQLAAEEAAVLGTAAQDALASSGSELERVRSKQADLRVEQKKMAAQSPEGIKEAQALLIAQGKYYGKTDGLREEKTEAAMRARGEEIQGELAVLAERETSLASGAASPVQNASTEKRLLQIENEDKARRAGEGKVWLEIMLWVLEGARSLGLWVFVTSVTSTGTNRVRERQDELEELEHQNKLNAMRDWKPTPAVVPDPGPLVGADVLVAKVDDFLAADDAVVDDKPAPTTDQQRSRKGGQAAQHARRANKNQRKIPVSDDRQEDEMFMDAKEAAE